MFRKRWLGCWIFLSLAGVASLVGVGCDQVSRVRSSVTAPPALPTAAPSPRVMPLPPTASPQLKQFLEAAIAQSKVTTGYDPAWVKINYPNGDVPPETGVCSDVVVRAFRKAGIDLQKEVHEDMQRAWAEYPKRWGARGTDTNIDHRRVLNLMTYLTRQRKSLPVTSDRAKLFTGRRSGLGVDGRHRAHRCPDEPFFRNNQELSDCAQYRSGRAHRRCADVVENNRTLSLLLIRPQGNTNTMKIRITLPAALLLALLPLLVSAQPSSKTREDRSIASIRAVLDAQSAAWNRGDVEGYMDGYERSRNTVMVSGDSVTRGWQTVTDRYKKNYNSPEKMGTLTFSDLEFKLLGNNTALAIGRWHLKRAADEPHGRFTLIFKRTKQGWRIIHDHTSSAS